MHIKEKEATFYKQLGPHYVYVCWYLKPLWHWLSFYSLLLCQCLLVSSPYLKYNIKFCINQLGFLLALEYYYFVILVCWCLKAIECPIVANPKLKWPTRKTVCQHMFIWFVRNKKVLISRRKTNGVNYHNCVPI